MEEVWNACVNYDYEIITGYEVSNNGKVRSIDRRVEGRKGVVKGKILSAGYTKDYQHVVLSVNNKQKNWFVHVLVALAFPEICGKYEKGLTVDHLDGNKLNNNANNLRFKTLSDNMRNPNTWDKKLDATLSNVSKTYSHRIHSIRQRHQDCP